MPYCEIISLKGTFTEEQRGSLADGITGLLLKSEGLEDNPVSRSLAVINFLQPEAMYIGGDPVRTGKVIVKVHLFEEALTDETKQSLLKDINRIFQSAHGETAHQKGNNVWCILSPLRSKEFGAGPRAVTLELTRRITSLSSPSDSGS